MKKNTKKGFTLVELVIVIAVIAILSAILIPTFGDIISNANETAYQKAADSAFTEALDKYATKVSFDYAIVVYYDGGIKDDLTEGALKGTATRAYKIDASKNITLIEETPASDDAYSSIITEVDSNKVSTVGAISPEPTGKVSMETLYKINDKCAIAFFKNAA